MKVIIQLVCLWWLSSTPLFGGSNLLNEFIVPWFDSLNAGVLSKSTPRIEVVNNELDRNFRQGLLSNDDSITVIKETAQLNSKIDMLTNTDTIMMMSHLIILVEVGPFIAELNEAPYLSHGLLQPTTSWLRKRNTDTSFGWFGFIFGTLADTIDDANTIYDGSDKTFAQHHATDIDDVHSYLNRLNFNVPRNQVVAFYTYYMKKIALMQRGPVSLSRLTPEFTKMTRDAGASYDFSSSDVAHFEDVVAFYKVYNGQLDKNKIQRLAHDYRKSKLILE